MLGILAVMNADILWPQREPERSNTVVYETPTKVCDPKARQIRTVEGEYAGGRFVAYPSPLASQLCGAAP